ncbi:Oidioi.mRNA.OKI2018_I69.chr2.g7455.t1.cds [Oikopleura dioica]|uniref:Oidioi.mRNA.OKI2018_I69.chr2.g7455.t1.cds n=1 Tax=Oikopleura dioica TaxID=34765 RepID=A0ABN7TC73_OIKDI|nr:Oidioi.mRNA.OKI2018_I69.chr2.g7455.t1.cds [Oikopleura dioica]
MNISSLFLIFHATVTAQEAEITTKASPVDLSNSTEAEVEPEVENMANPATESPDLSPKNGTTTDTPLVRPITSAPIESGFDFGSFIGGAVLAFGVTATVYFGIKFYRAHNPDYRHI